MSQRAIKRPHKTENIAHVFIVTRPVGFPFCVASVQPNMLKVNALMRLCLGSYS